MNGRSTGSGLCPAEAFCSFEVTPLADGGGSSAPLRPQAESAIVHASAIIRAVPYLDTGKPVTIKLQPLMVLGMVDLIREAEWIVKPSLKMNPFSRCLSLVAPECNLFTYIFRCCPAKTLAAGNRAGNRKDIVNIFVDRITN
jgi:hypothetical protein